MASGRSGQTGGGAGENPQQITLTLTVPPEFYNLVAQIAVRLAREEVLFSEQEGPTGRPDNPVSPGAKTEEDLILTVEQAARLLRTSKNRIYDLIKKGDIPFVRFGPRSIRIPRPALAQWAVERATTASDELTQGRSPHRARRASHRNS